MKDFLNQIEKRRTFAIISHPDAGKTTLTEKLLLYGGAIQQAGIVKGKKGARAATSDWMEKVINMQSLTGWKLKNSVVFPLQVPFCSLTMTVTV